MQLKPAKISHFCFIQTQCNENSMRLLNHGFKYPLILIYDSNILLGLEVPNTMLTL